jgi:outer membrane immunogenic protein
VKLFGIATVLALAVQGSAAAAREREPFAGPFAGLEGGVLEHHYGVVVQVNGVTVRDDYQRSWGVGGGVFVGGDVAVSERIRLGIEGGLVVGGATNTAVIPGGGEFSLQPRWGYRLTARAGVVVSPELLVYATGGFGGHRYNLATNSAGLTNPPLSGDSFIIGGGVEYRVTDRIGIRFDFKHLDNQTNQFFVGLPIRF